MRWGRERRRSWRRAKRVEEVFGHAQCAPRSVRVCSEVSVVSGGKSSCSSSNAFVSLSLSLANLIQLR
jgi:shikimate kinase